MARGERAKNEKPAVEVARQAFLYGQGDGHPINDTAKLAKVSGLHPQTILKHMKKWLIEREEILSNSSNFGLGLSLSAKQLDAHKADQDFIRDKMNSIKWEVENIDDCIETLEGICDNFSLNTENGDKAMRLFENYLRASMNRKNLLIVFLSLKKEWDQKTGIDALRDAAGVGVKEIAKGKAKIELKNFENQGKGTPRPALTGGVFAKSNTPLKAAETELDEED